MDTYYVKLGIKLREIRDAKKMTLVEVSEKINMTYKAIANYETARRKISTPILISLCEVYNYDVAVLLDESVSYLK